MKLIGRRNFVSGLGLGAGAHLFSPICKRLIGEAQGQTVGAKRFIIYHTNGGMRPEVWPKNAGGKVTLSSGFTPLEPYLAEYSWVDRLYNPHDTFLHGNGWGTLTAVGTTGGIGNRDQQDVAPSGASIDRHVALKSNARTPFPSLNLLHDFFKGDKPGFSADGPGKTFPYENDMVKSFQRVFANVSGASAGGSSGGNEALLRREQRLLTTMREDIKRMQARLAGAEKAKLDQYIASLTGLEDQIKLLATASFSCGKPATPGTGTELNIAGMVDIAANALACGLTNVVVLGVGVGELPFLGGGMTFANHNWWHGNSTGPTADLYYKFHTGNIAKLWSKLKAVKEGNGTMADNTVLLHMCTNGGQHHHGYHEYGVGLLGTAGGKIRQGQYLQFATDTRFIGDLFSALATAVGVPTTSFGDAALNKGPLPGVLA